MSFFKQAVELILANEGGFTNDPLDSGGATNWGITQHDYEQYLGRPVFTQEIKDMTKDEAIEIYEAFYWKPLKLDQVMHPKLATLIFDQGVNRGVTRSAKDIQKVLGLLSDGKIGPVTIKALNQCDEIKTSLQFIKLSQTSYIKIVLSKPNQIKFLQGWINRTHKLLDFLIT